jgi:hypothetical protein
MRQRHVFALGVGAAGIPIFCQLLMGLIMVTSGKQDFPKADPALGNLHFWDVQMVLLCVAIAGNTLVDFGKHVIDHTAKKPGVVLRAGILGFFFFIISLLFSVTLLGTDVLSTLGIPMLIFGAVDLVIAYVVDMDLALIEANLLE